MDINGFACAIELFLGLDVLTEPDGSLMPVQWKGYDSKLKQYQGELLHKATATERFRRKLTVCEEAPTLIDCYDWKGIELVLNQIREAFRADDEHVHLQYEAAVRNR